MPERKGATLNNKRIRRQRKITAKLISSIALIFFIAVSVITLAYNSLPEWVYYLSPAVRLYIAADEISNAYDTGTLNEVLRDVEKKYDAMCEITRKIAGLK